MFLFLSLQQSVRSERFQWISSVLYSWICFSSFEIGIAQEQGEEITKYFALLRIGGIFELKAGSRLVHYML